MQRLWNTEVVVEDLCNCSKSCFSYTARLTPKLGPSDSCDWSSQPAPGNQRVSWPTPILDNAARERLTASLWNVCTRRVSFGCKMKVPLIIHWSKLTFSDAGSPCFRGIGGGTLSILWPLGSGAKEWDSWAAYSWDEWHEHTCKLPSFLGYFCLVCFNPPTFFRDQLGNMILLVIGKVGWGAIMGNSERERGRERERDYINNGKTW